MNYLLENPMEEITLSVVIPAYKEQNRLGPNLTLIIEHLETFLVKQGLSYEVIVVVDGSGDGTADFARSFSHKIKNLSVIDNQTNRGKGAVIRQGLLAAQGKYHAFLDADGSTSIRHIDAAMKLIESGADFVIGSRDIPGAVIEVHQPRHREIMGTLGNFVIRATLGLWSFPDTQCGFKVLKAEVSKAVVPRMVVDRFAYDFEMIVLAKKLGFRIEQMPVHWINEEGSTVGGLFGPNGFLQVLIDLLKTRLRLFLGMYHLHDHPQVETQT